VRETVHRTLAAFVELLRLSSLTELQEQYVEQARENLALAERLLGVGRYAEADVLRWRVEEAQQNGLLFQQQNARKIAALSVENLIGASPTGSAAADPKLPARLVQQIERFRAMSEEQWGEFMQEPVELVVADNPERRILDLSERLAQLEHRQSMTAFLPSVTIAGAYGWQHNNTLDLDGEKAWSITAALSVPIFTGFSNYSGRQVTKRKYLQTRETVRDGHRSLLLAAEAARTGIRNSAAQLRIAEASLESARRNHEIMKNRFTVGQLSNLEWIDANLALQNAEQTHTSAYYDLVLAIADYYQASGRIDLLLADALPVRGQQNRELR
jgi:outer membrane protein TolC